MKQSADRKDFLYEILHANLTETEVDNYFKYNVIEDDINLIQKACRSTFLKIPQTEFNCAMLSSVLGAMIQDNSSIPAVVLAGHLDVDNRRIFYCKSNIPNVEATTVIKEIWEGHCWVEINNLIIDVSLLRTIHYGNTPDFLLSKVKKDFGNSTGALILTSEKFYELGFHYTPCYLLSKNQINGLIRGAQQAYNID